MGLQQAMRQIRGWGLVGAILLMYVINPVHAAPLAGPPPWRAGQDYGVLPPDRVRPSQQGIQLQVFFSYACPWCGKLEPVIQHMAQKYGERLHITRIPVTFKPGWDNLARAYYVANSLHLDDKVHHTLFQQAAGGTLDMTNPLAIRAVFEKLGVTPAEWDTHFQAYSVSQQLKADQQQFRDYQLQAIPAVVVNGRYTADLVRVQGNIERFQQLLDYLLEH